jgi:hypothetical protein
MVVQGVAGPSIPYTFHTVAHSDEFLRVHAWQDYRELHLDVLEDPMWAGLRYTDGIAGLQVLLGLAFPLSLLLIGILCVAEAFIALGIFLGFIVLLAIAGLLWLLVIPTQRVIFDWETRTLRGRAGAAISFDEARIEIWSAPRGHAVWALGPTSGRIIGFFPREEVALAYRARIEHLMRTKQYSKHTVLAHLPAAVARVRS